MVQILVDKGFAYQTEQAIYFDVTKVADYGKLSGQKLADKEVGARAEVITDEAKHHPQDFALWFFTTGRFKDHQMHWSSPWGEGFPGWHLECSAIIHQSLGETIDIHTGGVDHIGTHHTNEIAQSEAAFDKPLARFWLHNEFLQLDGDKMAKSGGGVLTLEDLVSKGINPLAFRYLCLTAHYRSQLNFTWESLQAAEIALKNLYREVSSYALPADRQGKPSSEGSKDHEDRFLTAINNDLDTPAAIAVVWDLVKSNLPDGVKLNSLVKFDKVLGLGLEKVVEQSTPSEVNELVKQREKARVDKDFARSDELRKQIAEKGFEIVDEEGGPKLKRIIN
jgi:cysteinyl-tRNA synthetase